MQWLAENRCRCNGSGAMELTATPAILTTEVTGPQRRGPLAPTSRKIGPLSKYLFLLTPARQKRARRGTVRPGFHRQSPRRLDIQSPKQAVPKLVRPKSREDWGPRRGMRPWLEG